jgi:hypothetical protein
MNQIFRRTGLRKTFHAALQSVRRLAILFTGLPYRALDTGRPAIFQLGTPHGSTRWLRWVVNEKLSIPICDRRLTSVIWRLFPYGP